MYFPISVPLEYRFPKASKEGEEPICISSNRDRSLILLLTKNTLHIWFCKVSFTPGFNAFKNQSKGLTLSLELVKH